jgi:hypothetical protein
MAGVGERARPTSAPSPLQQEHPTFSTKSLRIRRVGAKPGEKGEADLRAELAATGASNIFDQVLALQAGWSEATTKQPVPGGGILQ